MKRELRARIKAGDTTVPQHIVDREKNRGVGNWAEYRKAIEGIRQESKELTEVKQRNKEIFAKNTALRKQVAELEEELSKKNDAVDCKAIKHQEVLAENKKIKSQFKESLTSFSWSHSVVEQLYKELLPVMQQCRTSKSAGDPFLGSLFALTQVYHNGHRDVVAKTFLDQHLGTGWAAGIWKQMEAAKQ